MATDLYPFDPTGTNPLCRITNEQQVVTAVNDPRRYNYIIPKGAPFFAESFQFVFRNPDSSVRVMVEGVDYYFSNHFISASRACARPVYGSVQFLDRDTTGVIQMTYQTIGGNWTLDLAEITEIIANNTHNPRVTAWEQITDLPYAFPVIDHEWDLIDMVGASEIVNKLTDIAQAIVSNSGGGLPAHIANLNNPHQTTKAQVGLNLVMNYPLATQSQAQGGTNNTTYMTPLRTKEAIAALSGDLVAAHADRTDNPHQTTKAHVGLSLVQNYAVANATEAQAGTRADLYMTPATVAGVVAIVRQELQAHASDHTNPHETDADQVGLWNVENYGVATQAEALAGTSNTTYMTPLRSAQLVTALAGQTIAGHTGDVGNPHSVTKTQVGLGSVQNFGLATTAEASDPDVVNKYMTPSLVAVAIGQLIGLDFTTHLNATNPHNVTKEQVGLDAVENYGIATNAEATAGTLNNKYMTPLRVREAATGLVNLHASNTDNPHTVTAEQVGAYTKTAVDNALLDKLGKNEQATDAARLNNMTANDIIAEAVQQAGNEAASAWNYSTTASPEDQDNTIGFAWIRLGVLGEHDSGGLDITNDAHWLVAGGEALTDTQSPLYRIHMGVRPGDLINPVTVEVEKMTAEVPASHQFAYLYDDVAKTIVMYMRLANGNKPIGMTRLSAAGETNVLLPLDPNEVPPLASVVVVPKTGGSALTAEFTQFKTDTNDQFGQITQGLTTLAQAIADL